MSSRRDFLRTGLFSAAAMALLDPKRSIAAPNGPPMRFIFMHRGNGLFRLQCCAHAFGIKDIAYNQITPTKSSVNFLFDPIFRPLIFSIQ